MTPAGVMGWSFFRARKKEIHPGDTTFSFILKICALGLPFLLLAITVLLCKGSLPAINEFGWNFLSSSAWDPVREKFGALPVIYGTVISSLLALLLAAPISIGVSLFLIELAPPRISKSIGFLIEMLAAIPSVVYGLWGILVLAPWLRTSVEPFLAKTFGFLPLFQGPPYGVGMLAAGIILAIMITPTITAISKEVFKSIPRGQREAALALGATRWETMRLAVLKGAKSGVFGAIILGLGRALGETMAVTMVIGNRSQVSSSLFAPGQTMASVIANEYAEATSRLHLSALMEVGLILLFITFVIYFIARIFVWRSSLGRSVR